VKTPQDRLSPTILELKGCCLEDARQEIRERPWWAGSQCPLWLLGFIFLSLSTLFWFIALRLVSLPFLVASWVLFPKLFSRRIRPPLIAWALFLALSFSPIDVMPFPKHGPVRLVPLVMGLPTAETLKRAKRGEVILGGCIVSGFEPKYYLVW
jgi:hypothetical protein